MIQRDGIVIFADTDQPETEVRLIAFLIKAEHNQRLADPPDQQRTQYRVQQGKPHHIAGQGNGMLGDHKGHRPADMPENGNKRTERHQAGEQAERQR
ncbi:hypothetical protein D3C75_817400 [compost metagenome]